MTSAVSLHLHSRLPLPLDRYLAEWRILDRDRAAGRVAVRIWLLRRSDVTREHARAEHLRIRLVRIGVKGERPELACTFPTTDTRQAGAPVNKWAARLAWLAGSLLFANAVATATSWVVERRRTQSVAAPLHRQAETLRGAYSRAIESWQPVSDLQIELYVPDAWEVLETLTQTLPLNAWLTEVQVESQPSKSMHVVMAGIAPQAGGVAQAFSTAPGWSSVSLANSMAVDSGVHRERFQISADWAIARAPVTHTTIPVASRPGGSGP